jgi:hypothetical protein
VSAALERLDGDDAVLNLKRSPRQREYLADPRPGPSQRLGEERLIGTKSL